MWKKWLKGANNVRISKGENGCGVYWAREGMTELDLISTIQKSGVTKSFQWHLLILYLQNEDGV
jgi:hypothetical protein